MTSLCKLLCNTILILSLVLTSCVPLVPSAREQANIPDLKVQKHPPAAPSEDGQVLVDAGQSTVPQQKLQQDINELEQQQVDFNQHLASMVKQNLPVDTSHPDQAETQGRVTGRQQVSLHFDSADLLEVVRLFMQELLKQDFLVYPGVKGQVTMDIDDQLTHAQIQHLLEGVLQINQMGMLYRDNRWHVMPLASIPAALAADNLVLPHQDAVVRGQKIKAYRLEYIAVAELVKILTPYLSKGAQVYAHESSGVVLVSDYPHVLEKIDKLISLFDVSPFAGMHMKVYWPKYVLTDELIKELDALAKGFSLTTDNSNSSLSFLALPRLNLLLAMTRNAEFLKFVDMWIEELDREEPQVLQQNQGEGIFVYSVKNSSADDIVSVLKGLFGAGGGVKNTATKKEEKLPSGVQLTRLSSGLEKTAVKVKGEPDAVSGTLNGPVSFVVDTVTNAVLVRSSSADYRKIRPIMEKLDVYPKQVLIEVSIAEVQLDESTKLGIEWQHIMKGVAGSSASGTLSVDSGLGVISGSGESLIGSGLSYLLVNTNRFTAALKAFSDQNRVNILSSHHILASDNEEAKIDIGDEVPIVTSEYRTTDSTSTTTNVDKTIQYRDVGVLLSVTPHINDNGMVRMEVSQEVSELSNKTVEGVNSPVFSKRSANTKMSVRDGQTVVIAGLMQQTSSKAYSGVPWIGRLPLLRYFFGYEGHTFRNTELMIFITPHVILNGQDSEFVNRSFLDRLEKIRAAERL